MSDVAADGSSSGRPGGAGRGRSRQRLIVLMAIAVTAVVAVVAGVTASGAASGFASPPATTSTAPATATVQRTNLAETTPVNGTVGFAGPVAGGPSPLSIVQPAGTSPSVLDADQESVTAAQQAVAADQEAAQDSVQNQAKLAADQLTLAKALSAAAGAQASETAYDQTSRYTALPEVGQVIQPGEALWSIDGRPVALIPGTLIPWRAFTAGMTPGPDVAALDQALIALGDGAGLPVSNDLTDATVAAIDHLEATVGDPQTGTLALGAVIFEPVALRVTAVHPLLGAPVSPGAPVLDVTSTTPVVNVALPVGQTYLVKVGDPVSVNLPDGTTAEGAITAVGTVATTAAPSPGAPSGSASAEPTATVNVTVTVAHAGGAATLDQAPVTVDITNATADNTLAVPTTALLALASGGYAVEVVDPNGTHHLAAVTTGIFDDQAGLVQVAGPGLAAGQTVVAAS